MSDGVRNTLSGVLKIVLIFVLVIVILAWIGDHPHKTAVMMQSVINFLMKVIESIVKAVIYVVEHTLNSA